MVAEATELDPANRMGRLRPLAALLIAALAALWGASAAHAFSVSKWEAGTCTESDCTDAGPSSKFYRQAAGHPDFGITDFRFASRSVGLEHEEPEGKVKDVRVDLPAGLAVNPLATEQCSEKQLEEFSCPAGSKVGEDEAVGTATVRALLGGGMTVTEKFPVYNMQRKPGQPARFGVEVNSSTLQALALLGHDLRGHIYLEGGISWHHEAETPESSGVATGDYHEFFKIQNLPQEPEIIESKLIFWGVPQEHTHVGSPTAFITLPSTCSEKAITYLHVDSYEAPGAFQPYSNPTPVTATGCEALAFAPSLSLTPETTQSDAPDGASADLHVPQRTDEPSKPNSPDVQTVQATLPAGMTLDPSAANGLQACGEAQYEAGACPAASQVGTVAIDAPGIPDGSLTGGVYVATPEAGHGPESGGEYRLFLLAEAAQYGVGVRLEGRVSADTGSGRLTATFANAPQVPFEDFVLHFDGGPRAPLANPLACAAAAPSASVLPYGGEPAKQAASSGFTVSGCPAPLPFALTQSLAPQSTQAGAFSSFSYGLARADGQQYLSHLATTLPPGLIGEIPSVPLCGEAQADAGTCPQSSQIGTVTVAAGAGGEPYEFAGKAYLTGPYGSFPYGLSIVVPAVAGPYDLGDVVTRAGIGVGMYDARIAVTSALPTIVGGVPLRLRSLEVAVNRPKFALNPTSCAPLTLETLLGSTEGASDPLSSPFQATGCEKLAFKPHLAVSTSAKASKANGASIHVRYTQPPGQANVRELQLQLPKQLVARFSTIQKSCPVASFQAGGDPPGSCEAGARVGTVSVLTPALPGRLTGTAWLVSHASEEFPDLDLVLSGDGIKVVLVGHNHIARSSITTSTFETLPDIPVSSVDVDLPLAANSALAANPPLCGANLTAPTTLVAQNGSKLTQSTRISVTGCSVRVLSHRLRGRSMVLTLWAPEAGRVRIGVPGGKTVTVKVRKAGTVKVRVPLSPQAIAAVHRRSGKVKLRIGFTPAHGANKSAVRLALR